MRDVMKENAARELFCPLRAAYCRGDACMAWVVSWENNNEGYCAAFRATYEQEIGEGWKKYGRRIMDTQKKLLARLKQAEAERDAALAELARLREVERLAGAYRAAVMGRRAHKGVDPYTDDSPLGMRWGRRMEELTTVKRAAGEALFAALDKETAPNG